jgi:hypothetical protein
MSHRGLLALAFLLALAGCRQNDDPEGAKQLFTRIQEGGGYRSWRRAPEFPSRKPSFTAHSDEVEIYVNAAMSQALDAPAPAARWPEGSIVVKEGYSGADLQIVAVMEKKADGWYWAEYDGDGDPLYSGRPTVCTGCHDSRAGSDWVYAIDLPR